MSNDLETHSPKTVCGIIAFFNEELNIEPLVKELFDVFSTRSETLKLVLVDDGSTDASYQICKQLQANNKCIAIVRLSRNFGHHTALLTGIKHAQGDLFFLLDADFQDDPQQLPELLDALTPEIDLVYAIRNNRVESLTRRIAANVYWWLVNAATDHYCEPNQAVMRVFTKPIRNTLAGVNDFSPFLAGLFAWSGHPYTTVDVPHHPRRHGESKYSFAKLMSSTATSLLSFTHRPLRLLAYGGFIISALAILFGLALMIWALTSTSTAPGGWTSTFVGILFSLGIQLSALGLVGEYVGRIFHQTGGRPPFVVREFRDWNSDA